MVPGWLLHGDLPPTGNPIHLGGADSAPTFSGYRPHWVQSGTAALALGLMAAKAARPGLRNPSVILPAYGCPDLIAAATYAGLQPVLVDIDVDDPGYDLDALARAIDADTVAVVAVNFLGIRERLTAIRDVLAAHPDVLLIEDNAQWFPESGFPEPLPGAGLQGDMAVLSFGRGKPVSLLGGGALLVRDGCAVNMPAVAPAQEVGASLALKVAVFNLLLHRRLYALVNRNPLFELGQTVFKPLHEVRVLDALRCRSVSSAARRYLAQVRDIETAWQRAFPALSLSARRSIDPDRCGRLLRYPILCDSRDQRDRLWSAFDRAGLGVSALYRVALPEVRGVEGRYRLAGDYPHARSFAERLLTLPVHVGVRPSDIRRAVSCASP
jgi:dTDP-4-amino-4,6-dideoxygalactose transaminase